MKEIIIFPSFVFISGNIFLNVALSAVIQIPGTLFTCWATKAWGRRKTLLAGNILAGVFLILIGVAPSEPTWIKPVLSTTGNINLIGISKYSKLMLLHI